MFSSAELRWFIKGDIPTSVEDWFNNFDVPPITQMPRTDYYLRLPDSKFIGIKMREGRLEFKQRLGTTGQIHTGNGLNGIIEYYQKWSFSAHNINAITETIDTYSDDWLGVKKFRRLHAYKIDGSNIPRQAADLEYSGNGCILEITNIILEGQQENWWTLGFESYGDVDLLESSLLSTVGLIADNNEIPGLGDAASYGYAEWIQNTT